MDGPYRKLLSFYMFSNRTEKYNIRSLVRRHILSIHFSLLFFRIVSIVIGITCFFWLGNYVNDKIKYFSRASICFNKCVCVCVVMLQSTARPETGVRTSRGAADESWTYTLNLQICMCAWRDITLTYQSK